MVCLYAEHGLVTKTEGTSKFYRVYQVGKEGGEVRLQKGLGNKSFEKETFERAYDTKEKKYASKMFFIWSYWIYKESSKDVKKRIKKTSKYLWCKGNKSYCDGYIVLAFVNGHWELQHVLQLAFREDKYSNYERDERKIETRNLAVKKIESCK